MQHVKARQGFRALRISQQHAERLRLTSPYAPAQLVQLGKAETVGVFNNHQRGIWHVNANFYNRSADKRFYFTAAKSSITASFSAGFILPCSSAQGISLKKVRCNSSKLPLPRARPAFHPVL